MKLAHFGTFDVENYGDLLFPLILERRLSDLVEEFVHGSPAGGPPPWKDCRPSVASATLLNEHSDLDAVVIGGGNILHASSDTVRLYDTGAVSSSLAYPSLWLGAAYLAARGNLPLCWNAPGVPRPLSPAASSLMSWTASNSEYLAVRDAASLNWLKEAGLSTDDIEIVPDTGLEVSKLWSSQEILHAYELAFTSRGKEVPERTLAFHLNARYLGEGTDSVAERIDEISREAEATPVLLAIGPCHGDDALQREVAKKLKTASLLIDKPHSLREIAACIARSEAYVGSSMHGLITACSFGRRAMVVASRDMIKFTGFLEQFALSDWHATSWTEAGPLIGSLLDTSAEPWETVLERADPILDRHWERLRSTLNAKNISGKPHSLQRLRSLEREWSRPAGLYGSLISENLTTTRSALLTAQDDNSKLKSELKQKEQDLKQKERDLHTLENWLSEVSGLVPALFASKQWRVGHGLGEFYRRVRRSPRVPTAATQLSNVVRQYRSWKVSRAGTRSTALPSETRVEGRPERAARILFELATRQRPLTPLARSISNRGLSAGKRRLRRELRKLRPRMSRAVLAARLREHLGPVPERLEWPFVSIIVLNRNGRGYLEKLFSGLSQRTDYPGDFEVVLVDNGSSDGSVQFARGYNDVFKVRVVENRENVTFSDGNNQGARAASGDLLLFMNNDVEPFERGWLKELVAQLQDEKDAGAVGARLLYPGVTEHDTPSGYAVQHRGIKFKKHLGEDYPRNLGVGEDALDKKLGKVICSPATQAACLLTSRRAFEKVEGFTSGYRYGSEDVDLGLKLICSGYKVLTTGRANLFHDESSSQNTEGRSFMRTNRMQNRRLFMERWGPLLHRELSLERLEGGSFWTEEPPHIAITLTSKDPKDGYGDWYTAHEMGDALAAKGWRVSYVQRKRGDWYRLPEGLDYLLVLIDQYDLTNVSPGITRIAWIRNWTNRWVTHPWFEDYDVVLASSSVSKDIVERHSNQKVTALMPIASNPYRFSPALDESKASRDYVFTGNFWGEERGAVGGLKVRPGEKFEIFGKGWQDVPKISQYARGPVAYDELSGIYSSAKLVIDDTASPTLPYGAVNSRVFDALASGTLVVTNCASGVKELFDEDFPTYTGPEELRSTLDALLADDARREELAKRYRNMVLRDHTYEKRAGELVEILRKRSKAPSFCIKTGIPTKKEAESWGDLHYARAIKRQLEKRGYPCRIQTLDEWDAAEGLACDIVLHLKGLTRYTPKAGQFNMLWNISHPEKLTPGECDEYDLVFVASRKWAQRLQSATNVPVLVLEQATDPEVFFPEYDPKHDRDLVFVGNSRRVKRKILADLLPTNRDLAVWGKDWEGLIDPRYVVGEYLPNREVHRAYSSASVVLNDHWSDMREHGYISNRIYDALASGAFVISDDLPELRDSFGDSIATYSSPAELRELVSYYLSSPAERERKSREGRAIVLSRHTFKHRIEEMLGYLRDHYRSSECMAIQHQMVL